MKTKYYLKQFIKILIHLWILGTIGAGTIMWGIELINNDGAFIVLMGWFTLFFYILIHGILGWMIEKTPLGTKRLKQQLTEIETDKKKQKNRIKLENENQEKMKDIADTLIEKNISTKDLEEEIKKGGEG